MTAWRDRPLDVDLNRYEDAPVHSGEDRSGADAEQTAADSDQTAADADQTSADRDQAAAEFDQRTADFDQALINEFQAGLGHHANESENAESHRAREASAKVRAETARARSEMAALRDLTALDRDTRARARDQTAEERDRAATQRDEAAAALDREIERRESARDEHDRRVRNGIDILLWASRDREQTEADRQAAAERRAAAALDRELAAEDRARAALDREQAARERAAASVDQLTLTLRRGVGLAALEREMSRAERTGRSLTAAYVDVDGLKVINDNEGHAAGDATLRRVTDHIHSHLRGYDFIARIGGDEFLCVMPDAEPDDARRRFDAIQKNLAQTSPPTAISVGLTRYLPGEPLGDLLARSDHALLVARGQR
jgi:diguanylate cyclase (GGDEF)-like protein